MTKKLASLRILSGTALALALWKPSLPWARRFPPPAAVVIDGSASMQQPAGSGGRTRWEQSVALARALAPRLGEGAKFFIVGEGLKEIPISDLEIIKPAAARSDLHALADLAEAAPKAAAVLLISDGRASGREEAVAAASRLARPLLAAGFWDRAEGPDLAVEEVSAPRLSYAGAPITVRAQVSWRGAPPPKIEVSLWQGRRRWDSVQVEASSGSKTEVSLAASVAETGPQTLRVEAAALPGESNLRNNVRSIALEVARDRIRVLYIAGRPGPHYGFLRAQLKTDPAVDLVSFVILRDPQDVVAFPDRDLSLIPFPPPETLIRQLPTFHAVILEEFAGGLYGLGPAFAAAIQDYVRRGGGLLVSGEGRFWSDGGPLRGLADGNWLVASLAPGPSGRFSLRAEIPSHPVASLAADARASAALWPRLPPVEAAAGFPWPRLARGQALLSAPDGTPVLSVREEGRGRLLLLSTLATWRWSLAGAGSHTWAYQRFWENAVRWLGESPGARSLRLARSEGPAPVGEPWPISAQLLGERRPAELSVEARAPGEPAVKGSLRHAGDGRYAGEIRLPRPGWYTLRAASGAARDETALEARSDWDEAADGRADMSLLERLASAAGGSAAAVEDLSARRAARWLRRHSGAGASSRLSWFWLALALGALFTEWALRRRRGEP